MTTRTTAARPGDRGPYPPEGARPQRRVARALAGLNARHLAGRRGGLRSGAGPKGATRDQLYNEARQLKIEGRSRMATETLELTIVFEEGEDGFIVASIPDIPGTHSQGRTREEAKANVLDALHVMLTPDGELADVDHESVRLTLER